MLNQLPHIKDLALAIAENSVHGIVVMNEDGHCVYSNRAWADITGFTTEDMKGQPVHDWVHHHRPDGRRFSINECPIGMTLGRNENVRNHRDLFFKKDGSSFPVSCSASTIRSEEGIVLKILEIRDITDDVNAERRKDDFLAMLAHELRNPLAPIAAAADLLQVGRLDGNGIRQASEVISRQVVHMSGLVNDLLDVSRVTKGLVTLDKHIEDVKSVLAAAVEQVRPLIEARQHWLAISTSPGQTLVHGDKKRLVQVFANILSNAAKYTPDGGEITVSIEALPGSVKIEIADNGIGMTGEMIERAFDLFTQAERPLDRTQGGLGIGLALVRNLLALHDGTVTARSAGRGMGTVLTIILPTVAGSVFVSEAGTAKIPVARRPLKVMAVDDSKDALDMLGKLLESLGHRVCLESDAIRALERSQAGSYDVFLLDLGLPAMNGMELARQIRQQPQHGESLIVAVTGYGQPHDRQNTAGAGFDDHLIKPVSLHTIIDVLKPVSGE